MKLTIQLVILFLLIIHCSADSHLRGHVIHDHNIHERRSSSNPFVNAIFGALLIIFAIPFLWYNERRAAITEFRLKAARDECTSISSEYVNSENEGKLVHVNGPTSTDQIVTDNEFGVSDVNLIKLDRKVEMYQWVKKTRKSGNETHVYYVEEWRDTFLESDDYSYGHKNDRSKWIVEKKEILNPLVKMGAFYLTNSLKSQASESTQPTLNEENIKQAEQNYCKGIFQRIELQGEFLMFRQQIGQTVNGDLRVKFEKYPCLEYTIVSRQYMNTFSAHTFSDKFSRTVNEDHDAGEPQVGQLTEGCCSCCKLIRRLEQPLYSIDWLLRGSITLDAAFRQQLAANIVMTWGIRLLGFLCIGLGFVLLFSPITYLVSFFPLLGNFLAEFTGFIFFLISFTIAFPISLLVISVAWIWYHPKIGVLLLLLAAAITGGILYFMELQS